MKKQIHRQPTVISEIQSASTNMRSMNSPDIKDRTRLLEIVAVLLTAIGKFVFMDASNKWRLPFIVAVIVFWSAYVLIRNRAAPGILRYWGFRTDNFRKVCFTILPFGLVAVVLSVIAGAYLGTLNVTWHILPLLILYPIWGTLQQFLLIGLTVGNMQHYGKRQLPRWFVIFISALLFGLIHYPFFYLMAATFLLALFYGFVYWRERNLYALGIFHGWLGAIYFYTIVDRDPFVEVFGGFM